MIVFAFLIGIGVFLVSSKLSSSRVFDLEDVSPENQGGNFKKDYDLVFEVIAEKRRVPFALLKAHAIQESSLNPKAFVNENPSGRSDRIGWASRGLMQVLWWPKSNRFEKYGYPDSVLNNGEELYKPYTNVDIAAQLIAENLKTVGGSLRDAINMYNTGKTESQFKAPNNYVDRVLKNYNILLRK